MDEQQRGRVRDDLKGIIKGEMHFDEPMLSLYSTDASIFQVRPIGVIVPRDLADVQALVRFAGETSTPLIARGAGTGLAGEALGKGLIVDLSRNFREILGVGTDSIRVQPGVTCQAVNERLASIGRRFAPDPASGAVCTIGGMLANDASGSRLLRLGYTRDHVQALQIVLDSGDVCTVGREPWPPPVDAPGGHLLDILNALAVLLEENRELIEKHGPRTPFDRCGYALKGVLTAKPQAAIDLARLLVGSEGTLALFTEATLRTIPVPEGRSMAVLSFASVDAALRAARKILGTGPAACELLDRRLLSLMRGHEDTRLARMLPIQAEAVLIVEFESDSPAQAQHAARDLVSMMMREEAHLIGAVPVFEPVDFERIWQLRTVALPSLYGHKAGAQPLPFVEDVGLPVDAMPEFMRRVQDILQEHETTATFLVHACTGQFHTRPFLDLQKPEDVSRLIALAESIHALALELGGTVSAQHGTGLARTPWVARQFGPLYPVLRQLKSIFDPKNIFNPGKIVDPEPSLSAWPLRALVPEDDKVTGWQGDKVTNGNDKVTRWQGDKVSKESPSDPVTRSPSHLVTLSPSHPVTRSLHWQSGEMRLESNHCNGCGHCRTEVPQLRMCPIFRATHAEPAAPRAKANLLRNVLASHVGPNGKLLASDEVRAVADLCVNCKMCGVECPAHVNIPKLMLETKAANVAEHGLDRIGWFFARLEDWIKIASYFPLLTNLALRSPPVRWLIDLAFGLGWRRRLPSFAPIPFLKLAQKRGWTKRPKSDKPCVALFVDVFANYFDPLLAEAAIAVLRHNGIEVFVPPGQVGCGMIPLAQGDVESARELCQGNLRVLAETAREGLPIVCLEPTSTLMFRQDMLDLIDDADARAVAGQAVELTQYLANLHGAGRLRTDFRPLELVVGHHVPCHMKALGQAPAGPALLRLIPRLQVHTIDVSCSGMAGSFGLGSSNHRTSLAAGKPMLDALAARPIVCGSTECGSCRVQMEDGTRKNTLHPVQYLALAYGLLPAIAQKLRQPGKRVTR